MQRCPKCNRTYQDDTQKFCTFDGGRLMVDAEAPTTFDLGPTPQTDPLGATVMGPAPDLNKTVAGAPLTSEIPPPPQTGPTTSANVPTWQDEPPTSTTKPAPSQPPQPSRTGQTGPTPTNPLAAPPAAGTPQGAQTSPNVPSGTLAPTGAVSVPPPPQQQSGPIASTAPVQSGAPGHAAAPAPAVSTTARPKSNRALLLVGGLALLFLLLIAGGAGFYFFAMRPKAATANSGESGGAGPTLEREAANTSSNANASNANKGASPSQSPVSQPPNSTRFVNTRDRVTGSLAEHFIDFSFYYPNGWTLDPKAGASGNFFKADRTISDATGDYLLESGAVSWYQSNGTMQFDRPIFPNRVEYFNNRFARDYPNYEKVSEGETTVNGLAAYQFTWKGLVKGTGKGDINLWGRVIFLPAGDEDARNGIVLLMLASSAAPEVKSLDDVGEKGELPVILKTFRLGPAQ